MSPHVLIIIAESALRVAMTRVLERKDLRVTAVTTPDEADRLARRFDAVVIHDTPERTAIADAGWLLARGRASVAIFYGKGDDVSHLLRAANLGSYVHESEGLHRLARCITSALEDARQALAVGADAPGGRTEHKSGKRRR